MAMTGGEQTSIETRWGLNLGDNRPKTSKACIVHLITLQLMIMRHTGVTGTQFQTAFDDALDFVNSKTEDARGLR